MNPKQILSSFVIIFFSAFVSVAQNPVTTLQHQGATQVFYGQNSFVEAYNASVDGDTLNLSVGGFTPPPALAKGITVVGAGHFPDSASVKIRTAITGSITINAGADSLQLEGMYINGNVFFASESVISNVKVLRCRFENAQQFNNNQTQINKWSFEECFIEGFIASSNMVANDNFLVKHCIINKVIELGVGVNAIIDGNIFLYSPPNINNPGIPIYRISGAIIKNNIFLTLKMDGYDCVNVVFYNNLFVASSVNFGTNCYGSNNYLGIPHADIFVNQSGNIFDYTHDYHFKNPETYIGTDGTQVGLYGGLTPFKEKGMPFNPQIISKSIATKTDENGNLNVHITVKAQKN